MQSILPTNAQRTVFPGQINTPATRPNSPENPINAPANGQASAAEQKPAPAVATSAALPPHTAQVAGSLPGEAEQALAALRNGVAGQNAQSSPSSLHSLDADRVARLLQFDDI